MNLKRLRKSAYGFTIWDLLAIAAVLIIAVGFLLPQISRGCKSRAPRLQCVSNLKQTALAFRMWANDHNEQFPMTVSAKQGGSAEFAASGDVFRHFLAVSNELNSPKVLACPDDKDRERAVNFTNFSNHNLSYFVNIDATQDVRVLLLSGDRNITGGALSNGCVMIFTNAALAGFTPEIHRLAGNVALVDGSVSQMTQSLFRRQVESGKMFPIRYAIPQVAVRAPGFWQTSLQNYGLWALIGISAIIAIALYAGMTRRLVARAASG